MEEGVISLTSYEVGYKNGASTAYLIYISLVSFSYYLVQKISLSKVKLKVLDPNRYNKRLVNLFALLANLIILFVILFVFGSINVLLGNIGKGEFRISLGFFGSVAMGIAKWTSPALLVIGVFYYEKLAKKRYTDKILLFVHFFVCSFMAASWGFKSFAITILIPALIVLLKKVSFIKLLYLGIFAFSSFIFFSTVFDDTSVKFGNILGEDKLFDRIDKENALTMVAYRATVLQGDVSWITWERYQSGVEFPSYWHTLLASFGDKISSLFLSEEEIRYNKYSLQLTAIAAKRSVESLNGSYNVTGTVFSEGVYLGGLRGVIFLSILAGSFMGWVTKLIKYGLMANRPVLCAISAVFFFKGLNWLNSGGIVGLIHISNLIYVIFTILVIYLLLLLSKNSLSKS